MPRKTNKTARVLNLLSNGTGEDTSLEPELIKKEEPASTPHSDGTQASNHHNDSEDSLASLIKDSLDKAIAQYQSDSEDTAVLTEAPETEDPPESESPIEISKPVEEEVPELPEEPEEPEIDYLYVNMMERLLQERQEEFMRRFEVCLCDRCQLDVKALVMTNLPPKYMVMPHANLAPMLNFYRSKYNISLVTELTKACLEVFNHPRHDQ